MSKTLTIALVGIGGYGKHYVDPVLDAADAHHIRLVGTIDPRPEQCRRWSELQALGAPHFNSLEAFYAAGHQADLVTIASPIQFHADQTICALEHGSHVLCEKPLCATPADAQRMLEAQRKAQRHVAIGYQWSFSDVIQKLKADILAGRFGAPRRLRCAALWPRNEKYYGRASWAGALADPAGRPTFDSPVNNACAHQLHNMLYVLGDSIGTAAKPVEMEAELYRANPITNYDTGVLRCCTDRGVEILFIASHAVGSYHGPVFSYEFDDAVIEYSSAASAAVTATFKSGSTISYGVPEEPHDRKLWMTISAIRSGASSLCPIEAAMSHTQAVALAQAAGDPIVDFPRQLIQRTGPEGERVTLVQGLDEALKKCYAQWKLPSELGYDWAAANRRKATRSEASA